ncbi:DUF3284 domain-containing protein [Metabacillus arenae]|uniref:SRPBCC family protein n=1 Tax=Metabacillus arenae TaxID=2771434 RepID=A0A926S0Z4_9BACI|nr:DUF3284 domain-containing protein [Metabacillus arenae]MBD1380509.1 SRPBCC family protein [Metabacillus arenae]
MAAFADSVFIKAPVDKVFSFAIKPENSVQIMENVIKTEKLTEGPIQVGTKFKETREIRGRKAEAVIECTKFIQNEVYSVKSEAKGLEVTYHYRFKEVDQGTQVDFDCQIKTSGIIMKLTKPLFTKILKKEDGEHLQKMKSMIERGTQ